MAWEREIRDADRSAFEVRVYGFDIDKAKPVAKALAQIVAGKL